MLRTNSPCQYEIHDSNVVPIGQDVPVPRSTGVYESGRITAVNFAVAMSVVPKLFGEKD
jgi:hypothetical protein